jgi:hypothetical protein
MAQLETMGWEVEDKVARIAFNVPGLLNAMSNEAIRDINIQYSNKLCAAVFGVRRKYLKDRRHFP